MISRLLTEATVSIVEVLITSRMKFHPIVGSIENGASRDGKPNEIKSQVSINFYDE